MVKGKYVEATEYAKSLEELDLATSPVLNVPWPPKIHITFSGWEASLVSNEKTYYIRKDGLVWIE